jgi:hypothetical protein
MQRILPLGYYCDNDNDMFLVDDYGNLIAVTTAMFLSGFLTITSDRLTA